MVAIIFPLDDKDVGVLAVDSLCLLAEWFGDWGGEVLRNSLEKW